MAYGLSITSWWRRWRDTTLSTRRARSARCSRRRWSRLCRSIWRARPSRRCAKSESAIEGGEDLPELDWTKAHLEFQLGHYENALEDYEKVLEAAQPQSGNYNAALCLEKLQRFEEAAEAFRKAAEMDPETGRSDARRGRLPIASAIARKKRWRRSKSA